MANAGGKAGGGWGFKMVGWKKMKALLNPAGFSETLKKNVAKATKLNGMMLRAEVRKRISDKAYSPNAKLTIALKGSSTPLVDDADLMNAISDVVIDWKTVFVGVKRGTRGGEFNLAAILHEGAQIEVTPKMRLMFFLLYEVSHGKTPASKLTGRAAEIWASAGADMKFYPLKDGTTHIVIPARHFFRAVFEDPKVIKRAKANWEAAVAATFEQLGGES
jgi:hypothetical protein